MENSTITLLEVVDEDQRNEREEYYINNINCVNDIRNLTGRNEKTYTKWKKFFWFCLITYKPSIQIYFYNYFSLLYTAF